jgi:hypothetical protein
MLTSAFRLQGAIRREAANRQLRREVPGHRTHSSECLEARNHRVHVAEFAKANAIPRQIATDGGHTITQAAVEPFRIEQASDARRPTSAENPSLDVPVR